MYIIRAVCRYVNNFFIDFEKINFYAKFSSCVLTFVFRPFIRALVNALSHTRFIIMLYIFLYLVLYIICKRCNACVFDDDFEAVKTIFSMPNFMLFEANFMHKKIKNV